MTGLGRGHNAIQDGAGRLGHGRVLSPREWNYTATRQK
ncbi:hypothetical protein ACPOL_2577 [Acidisarcina polymorpha]|uniref:Uncharacterized protein n=1 Tax=Acidisarcina polymorpha TaxID=2211140 RepID=A0A2Z5FZR8_9BACT|nr:hypothetical protein ACPOL_2577 [Acidisarcina polymorpha]